MRSLAIEVHHLQKYSDWPKAGAKLAFWNVLVLHATPQLDQEGALHNSWRIIMFTVALFLCCFQYLNLILVRIKLSSSTYQQVVNQIINLSSLTQQRAFCTLWYLDVYIPKLKNTLFQQSFDLSQFVNKSMIWLMVNQPLIPQALPDVTSQSLSSSSCLWI